MRDLLPTGFTCGDCGSPAVDLPTELRAFSAVRCNGCHKVLGTWQDYRNRVTAALAALPRPCGKAVISADP